MQRDVYMYTRGTEGKKNSKRYLATALLSGFLARSLVVYMTASVSKQVRSKRSGEDSALVTCSSMEPACKIPTSQIVILLPDHHWSCRYKTSDNLLLYKTFQSLLLFEDGHSSLSGAAVQPCILHNAPSFDTPARSMQHTASYSWIFFSLQQQGWTI